MRAVFLLLGLLLPLLAQAQFAPGSYVLAGSQVRNQGIIRMHDDSHLVVKDASGRKLKLTPRDVSSFRFGSHKYVTAGGFEVSSGLFGSVAELSFVEQLDSGQVTLLRYEYTTASSGPIMGAGGVMMGGGGYNRSLYLLRQGYSLTPIPENMLTGGGKKFQEALMPFFSARPDLMKLLVDEQIRAKDLPKVVRALNTGQPLSPTSSD